MKPKLLFIILCNCRITSVPWSFLWFRLIVLILTNWNLFLWLVAISLTNEGIVIIIRAFDRVFLFSDGFSRVLKIYFFLHFVHVHNLFVSRSLLSHYHETTYFNNRDIILLLFDTVFICICKSITACFCFIFIFNLAPILGAKWSDKVYQICHLFLNAVC